MAIDPYYEARKVALEQSVRSFRQERCAPETGRVITRARTYLAYLLGTVSRLDVEISQFAFTTGKPTDREPTNFVMRGDGSMAVTIKDNQFVTLKVVPKDTEGQPTSDPNLPISYSTDNDAVVTLVPSADGSVLNVGATGQLGTANVSGQDAAGLAIPVEAFSVIAGDAVAFDLSVSDPQDIPSTGIPTPDNAS